jgi:hypothetical protein
MSPEEALKALHEIEDDTVRKILENQELAYRLNHLLNFTREAIKALTSPTSPKESP